MNGAASVTQRTQRQFGELYDKALASYASSGNTALAAQQFKQVADAAGHRAGTSAV